MAVLQVDVVIDSSSDVRTKILTRDENAVRLAITMEKAPEESKKFLASLRADAYIKLSDNYRPLVSPILFSEERKEKADNK